jgi:hypothetical protein
MTASRRSSGGAIPVASTEIKEQVAVIAAFTWTFQDLLGPLSSKVEALSAGVQSELKQAELIEPQSIESQLLWDGTVVATDNSSSSEDYDFIKRFVVRLLKLCGRKFPLKYVCLCVY